MGPPFYWLVSRLRGNDRAMLARNGRIRPAARITASGWSRCGDAPAIASSSQFDALHALRDARTCANVPYSSSMPCTASTVARIGLDLALDAPLAKRRMQQMSFRPRMRNRRRRGIARAFSRRSGEVCGRAVFAMLSTEGPPRMWRAAAITAAVSISGKRAARGRVGRHRYVVIATPARFTPTSSGRPDTSCAWRMHEVRLPTLSRFARRGLAVAGREYTRPRMPMPPRASPEVRPWRANPALHEEDASCARPPPPIRVDSDRPAVPFRSE